MGALPVPPLSPAVPVAEQRNRADLRSDSILTTPESRLFARLDELAAQPDMSVFMEEVAPPNAAARRLARQVITASIEHDVVPREVTITAAEGFALWFRRGRSYIAVECYNDGGMAVLWEREELPRTWMIGEGGPNLAESLRMIANELAR